VAVGLVKISQRRRILAKQVGAQQACQLCSNFAISSTAYE
jgi:hypothetical protein